MIIDLRIQRDRIALEVGLLSSGYEAVQSILANSSDFISSVSNYALSSSDPAIGLAPGYRSFLKTIVKHTYVDVRPIQAFTPEGLYVTYLQYSDALQPAIQHSADNLTSMLDSLITYLSKLISNNDDLRDTRSFSANLNKSEKDREAFNKKIGACFAHGSTNAVRSVGKVIDRNADWEEVFSKVEILDRIANSIDRNVVKKKIDECVHLVDVFKQRLKGNHLDVSPEVADNLAGFLYQVASEVEFFSVNYYRVLGFNSAVNRTVEFVGKALDY